MKLFVVLFAVLVAAQAGKQSSVTSYDEVNGQAKASHQETDASGKRTLEEFKGHASDFNPSDVEKKESLPAKPLEPSHDPSTVTSTSYVTSSSSSSSTTTDENGHTKTTGKNNDYSSALNSEKTTDENGEVLTKTDRKVSEKEEDIKGEDGVNKKSSWALDAADKKTEDASGVIDEEKHYRLKKDN